MTMVWILFDDGDPDCRIVQGVYATEELANQAREEGIRSRTGMMSYGPNDWKVERHRVQGAQ